MSHHLRLLRALEGRHTRTPTRTRCRPDGAQRKGGTVVTPRNPRLTPRAIRCRPVGAPMGGAAAATKGMRFGHTHRGTVNRHPPPTTATTHLISLTFGRKSWPWFPRRLRDVLDIGCGAGRLGEAIKARQQAQVVGVELNEAAAEAARTRHRPGDRRRCRGDGPAVPAGVL